MALSTIRSRAGAPFTVASPYASQFEAFLNDLEQSGVRIDPGQSGGYNPRFIRGTAIPSLHASGRAIDVNWRDNPQGSSGQLPPDTARGLARRYGLTWGGDWRNPDPMHFEFGASAKPITGGLDPMTTDMPLPPSQTPPPQSPAPPPPSAPMGPPQMPMLDAAEPEQPGFLDRIMNPLTLAGLGMLASPAGQGAQGAFAGINAASGLAKNRMAQSEYQLKLAERQRLKRIWGEAFPGGQPNPNHPLTKGVPPELLATAYAMGPEQGLPVLGKLSLDTAENRMKMAEAEKQRQAIIASLSGLFNDGGQPGQPGAPAAPSPADAAFAQPAMTLPPASPSAAPGTSLGSGTPVPSTLMAPGAAPGPAAAPMTPGAPAAPAAPQMGQPSIWQDRDLRKIVVGNLLAGNTKGAFDALEAAAKQQRELRQAGPKKEAETLATKRAEYTVTEEEKAQSMREAWRLLDQVERFGKSLGNSRLSAAASPSLDTWAGKSFLRFAQPQAYNDRNQMLSYLDQINVMARQQLKGQGTITDAESEMVGRALSGARSATDDKTFFQNINVARSILANKIPEMRGQGFVPPQVTEREQEAAAPTGQRPPVAPQRDMVPPQGGQRVERLDAPELEGKAVYDNKTGRWGRVVNGEFVSLKELLKGKGTRAQWERKPAPAGFY